MTALQNWRTDQKVKGSEIREGFGGWIWLQKGNMRTLVAATVLYLDCSDELPTYTCIHKTACKTGNICIKQLDCNNVNVLHLTLYYSFPRCKSYMKCLCYLFPLKETHAENQKNTLLVRTQLHITESIHSSWFRHKRILQGIN